MADNTFENEHVIHRLTARLVPTAGEYPDCIASVVLTERHLFGVEDNFDGTVTTHIKVPVTEIVEIGSYVDERTGDDKPEPHGMSTMQQISASLMALAGAVRVSPRGQRKIPKRYMRVTLKPDPPSKASRFIFFADCSEKPERLGRALKAYRERR